ncbi:MAG: BtpA/SgcQ family protein [Promethearchaeota archaeon]
MKNKKLFLTVIHVVDNDQAKIQAEIAINNGADGIFLINHSIHHLKLFEIHKEIRDSFPNAWIGLNCLDLLPISAIKLMPKDINGLWVDNAFIDENSNKQKYPKKVLKSIKKKNWNGLYFGGVAFKYQREVNNLVKATEIACNYMDVITTSGMGTGIPPDTIKIKTMSNVVRENGKKLAIASGITPENIQNYKDADIFLVSTGISRDFNNFNPILVKELSEKIKKLENN